MTKNLELSKHLESIDIFGLPFYFTTFGKSRFKTVIGSFFTILFSIVMITFTFLFGRDFYYRENPKVLTQIKTPVEYPPAFKLNQDSMFFAWRISDENGYLVDHYDFLNVYLTHYYYDNINGTYIQTPLESKVCSEFNITNEEFSKNYKTDAWRCIDWKKYPNLTFGGFWDSNELSYFELEVMTCDKNADPKTATFEKDCTPLDKIKKELMNSIYIEVIYSDTSFSPNDYYKPFNQRLKNYYYRLDFNMRKHDRFFFKEVVLDDDKGWIFEDYKMEVIRGIDRETTDYNYFKDEDYNQVSASNYIYVLSLYSSKPFDNIMRSYMKIQDLGAILGGFIKFTMIIGSIISQFFTEYIRENKLIGKIFEDESIISNRSLKNRKQTIKENPRLNLVNKVSVPLTAVVKDTEKLVIYPSKNNDNIVKNKISQPIYLIKQNCNKDNSSSSKIRNGINNKSNSKGVMINSNDGNLGLEANKNVQVHQKRKSLKFSPYKEGRDLTKTEILEKRKETNINFGLCFSIKNSICCNSCNKTNDKQQKYKLVKKHLNNILDLSHYLNIIEQFEFIKTILMNDNQIKALKYLKKPNINDSQEIQKSNLRMDDDQYKSLNDTINYFKYKIVGQELDKYDNLLLEMIDPGILNILLRE